MSDVVFTIGHSTHSIERLIQLLMLHGIAAVCDVRSRPYSRMNPQFNRETLKGSLRAAGIKYVFLGEELGARSEDKSCYVNGQVQYSLLAKTALFEAGIKRIEEGAKAYRIALLCAEKEPLDCHRTILVGRRLFNDGIDVKHVLADGQLEDHAHAIERLIAQLAVPNIDMFREKAEVIDEAYARRAKAIAYREQLPENSESAPPSSASGSS